MEDAFVTGWTIEKNHAAAGPSGGSLVRFVCHALPRGHCDRLPAPLAGEHGDVVIVRCTRQPSHSPLRGTRGSAARALPDTPSSCQMLLLITSSHFSFSGRNQRSMISRYLAKR